MVQSRVGQIILYEGPLFIRGLMHYLLGLEVWQSLGEVLLGQGQYVVYIMNILKMMDCKPMATSMVENMKSFADSNSDLIDTSVYRQLISSLMYLVNTRPSLFLQ